MNVALFNTQFQGYVTPFWTEQPVFEPVVSPPAVEPEVQHTNLIGIVTRTSWAGHHKGLVQDALNRLAGKTSAQSDGRKTVEFQVITAEDRLDVHKLDNTHS